MLCEQFQNICVNLFALLISNIMSMPALYPENYEQVYDYFRDFEPNRRIQKLGFAAMHAVYNSEVHYEEQSEDKIHDHLELGGSIILAPNHHSNADIPTIAGLVYEEAFSKLRGTTIIPAKKIMFEWPIIGSFFPHMQAHPTFRRQDFSENAAGHDLRQKVTDRLIELNIGYINNGGNSAMFPEGTRNKHNPEKIAKLRAGIGKIAAGVDDPTRLLIVPAGIAYKHTFFDDKIKLHPLVVVQKPFCSESMSREDIIEETHGRIQRATNRALELAKR
jgi:1-acyl-sn-glycerol-3-phosphate acyltransferase